MLKSFPTHIGGLLHHSNDYATPLGISVFCLEKKVLESDL